MTEDDKISARIPETHNGDDSGTNDTAPVRAATQVPGGKASPAAGNVYVGRYRRGDHAASHEK